MSCNWLTFHLDPALCCLLLGAMWAQAKVLLTKRWAWKPHLTQVSASSPLKKRPFSYQVLLMKMSSQSNEKVNTGNKHYEPQTITYLWKWILPTLVHITYITSNSHSGYSSIIHGLSQTLLLFQTFPNFQVNISIVLSPVNLLHINLQVVNFQRWEHTFGSSKEPEPAPSTSGMSETAA